MNPQEREQLGQFLTLLTQARAGEKLVEADAMIREAFARQPDAAYLLVQRAMLLEQAMNAAKQQIAELQTQVKSLPATGSSGFLSKNPWLSAQEPAPVPGSAGYQIPRGSAFAGNALGGNSVGSSFLGNVAATAAGVVAGSFLFQGIENLLGHGHGGWGNGTSTPESFTENTTINNTYIESPGEGNWQTGGADTIGFNPDTTDFDDDGGNDESSWI